MYFWKCFLRTLGAGFLGNLSAGKNVFQADEETIKAGTTATN